AVKGNYLKVVQILLVKGVNVNTKDRSGYTPLDYAFSDKMKKLLKKAGGKSGKK
ncbi:MAG TPA: ankyrin repeat domain-containing protein, partial [Spirochaetes bacterium]|nr:ankyrin repeat domain-containing protein [Spirochaetota bacterium]